MSTQPPYLTLQEYENKYGNRYTTNNQYLKLLYKQQKLKNELKKMIKDEYTTQKHHVENYDSSFDYSGILSINVDSPDTLPLIFDTNKKQFFIDARNRTMTKIITSNIENINYDLKSQQIEFTIHDFALYENTGGKRRRKSTRRKKGPSKRKQRKTVGK